ncbi:hypothetical protein DFA_01404 [Cavenderia fasciculata]|uniref:Vacuolar protein 14 C-terminal Fig4-binding domain-containing protein n=1 Tax=Cavenderia fasciculata TaxID=261658 RepID=F4PSI8_CACFS|nr:uncharacterized protein DFA_01404 [Cavenderia fasciculata]EGG21518.1 hypothetical protein DFA_01404 [Cavenderia fasciculata]|eukprot:XP_004359368.1 hypothetical protein DFA_01404 [Cavenderia fasciculata]
MSKSQEPSPIPINIIKSLTDKNNDKRKTGAQEIEALVRELVIIDEIPTIKSIIKILSVDYTDSAQGNNKKGGLIGLASIAIALGQDTCNYLQEIIPPVLRCFLDHDSRVRFYACESLYNIVKVVRAKTLVFFNEIFDALCKLTADPDPQVKNGAQLFDRLLKDIVTESPTFDIDKFIPLLKERIYVINPFCRQFIVGWVIVLDSVPNIDMLVHLPKFLDGLFKMLRDQNKEIRNEADKSLSEFLKELQTTEEVDYGNMVAIIVRHCSDTDELTRLRALNWVNEFISIGREKLLPYSPLLLTGILPNLEHSMNEIENVATNSIISLHKLVYHTSQPIPMKELIEIITKFLSSNSVQSRLNCLRWILMLHNKLPNEIGPHLGDLFPHLLKTLSDSSDEVVTLDLEVVAKISDNTLLFDRLMESLVKLFQYDSILLRTRGNFIIRQLCLFLNPELIFRRFSLILKDENDADFASVMIQTLNLILLTSDECVDIRKNLKTLASPESRDLFSTLYKSWSHSPASLFSLCMLCQVYEHSCDLLLKFSEIEITVNFLMELDRLVQLLESPRFMSLRLQLLEPEKYPSLIKALYGLLMILPQSSAFETLKNRLTCISSLGTLRLIPKTENQDGNNISNNPDLKDIDFKELLEHFKLVQDAHEKYIRKNAQRKARSGLTTSSETSSPPKQSHLPYGLQNFVNKRVAHHTLSNPLSTIVRRGEVTKNGSHTLRSSEVLALIDKWSLETIESSHNELEWDKNRTREYVCHLHTIKDKSTMTRLMVDKLWLLCRFWCWSIKTVSLDTLAPPAGTIEPDHPLYNFLLFSAVLEVVDIRVNPLAEARVIIGECAKHKVPHMVTFSFVKGHAKDLLGLFCSNGSFEQVQWYVNNTPNITSDIDIKSIELIASLEVAQLLIERFPQYIPSNNTVVLLINTNQLDILRFFILDKKLFDRDWVLSFGMNNILFCKNIDLIQFFIPNKESFLKHKKSSPPFSNYSGYSSKTIEYLYELAPQELIQDISSCPPSNVLARKPIFSLIMRVLADDGGVNFKKDFPFFFDQAVVRYGSPDAVASLISQMNRTWKKTKLFYLTMVSLFRGNLSITSQFTSLLQQHKKMFDITNPSSFLKVDQDFIDSEILFLYRDIGNCGSAELFDIVNEVMCTFNYPIKGNHLLIAQALVSGGLKHASFPPPVQTSLYLETTGISSFDSFFKQRNTPIHTDYPEKRQIKWIKVDRND